MPGLNYSQYVTQIAEMAVVNPLDVNFVAILPAMIDYAELRMYRDLDFMFTSTSIHSPSIGLTAGNRNLSFPMTLPDGSGTIVVTEQLNLILPVGTDDPDSPNATRVALLPTTKEFLDAVYGSSATANRGQPKYFAPFNENLFFVGPVPDASYRVEVVATYRPNSLYVNPPEPLRTTFISQYFPDLFIMASMVYISAYQRNFGRQSDDPQMAQSYESQYMTLLKSASVEEARKKFEGPGWTSQSPSPISSPTRG
jgi:hypothetical protein